VSKLTISTNRYWHRKEKRARPEKTKKWARKYRDVERRTFENKTISENAAETKKCQANAKK
jgi:hypothetical protein